MASLPGWAPGDDLAEFVQSTRKPTVDFSLRRPQLKFPRVLEDHAHAAQLVADHFISRGFSNFMFYSDADNWSYEERGEAFVNALKAAGRDCTWLRWHRSPDFATGREEWKRKRKWLASGNEARAQAAGRFCRQRPAGAGRAGILREPGHHHSRTGRDCRRGKLSPGAGRDAHSRFERGHQPGNAGLSRGRIAGPVDERQAGTDGTHPRSPPRAWSSAAAATF